MTGPTDAELAVELRRIGEGIAFLLALFRPSDPSAALDPSLQALQTDRDLVLLAADRLEERDWS